MSIRPLSIRPLSIRPLSIRPLSIRPLSIWNPARSLRAFRSAAEANLSIIFALALIPIIGAIGAAVDYSQANSIKSSMQASADATALALVSQAATLTSAQLTTDTTSYFTANFNRPQAQNVSATSTYTSATQTLTVNASASYPTTFLGALGMHTVTVSTSSAATLAPKTWPICIMITDPSSGHTLLTSGTAAVTFNNCMVQVNTDNWDAVQADNTSYIHSSNGDNCFVGNIHYGDITPAKDPSCTMFSDPFASGYTMPSSASTCTYGWIGGGAPQNQPKAMQVQTNNQTLSPGTYCQGLQVQNVANVKFNPGVYIINGGELKLQGQGSNNLLNVTATGVTFLLTGNNADVNLQNVNLNMTPDTTDAGKFNGFLFFLDQTPGSDGKVHYGNQSTLQTVTMNTNGIIYLVGQQLQIKQTSNITLNTGSIIADMLLPGDSSILNVTGQLNTGTSAQIALQKAGESGTNPVLVH